MIIKRLTNGENSYRATCRLSRHRTAVGAHPGTCSVTVYQRRRTDACFSRLTSDVDQKRPGFGKFRDARNAKQHGITICYATVCPSVRPSA